MLKKISYTLIAINILLFVFNIGFYVENTKEETIAATPEENPSYIEESGDLYLSESDQIWALKTARTAIENYLTDKSFYVPDHTPEIFSTSPRKVYVSLYNIETHELRSCKSRQGAKNLGESIVKAAIESTKDSRFETLSQNELDEILIDINILNSYRPILDIELDSAYEPGIDGIRLLESGSSLATFLPGVATTHNYDKDTLLEKLCLKADIAESCYQDTDYYYQKFTTFAFIEDGNGGTITLKRTNNYIDEIDLENIEYLVTGNGEWLLNHTHENGEFDYMYYPSADSYSDSYNIVRHIGTTYALLLMYEYTNDTEYLESAEKAIAYMLQYYKEEGEMGYIEENSVTKLGSVAIGVLVMDKAYSLTGSQEYFDYAEKFGTFLLDMQMDNGNFKNQYPNDDTDNEDAYEIYGAETNLALTRLYAQTGKAEYLTALEKSYTYTKTYFDESPSTMMVSWDTGAFSELFYLTGNQNYADLAYQAADFIIAKQYTEETAPYWDYVGAFNKNGAQAINTATYSEGVGDALKLAIYQNNQERIEKYTDSLELSMKFLVNMQFREDNSFYLECEPAYTTTSKE